MRILIKNGTIVNANGRERKDILTDGDRIIAIGGNLDAAGAEVIDAAGCYVMPGFIDTHTHFDLDVGLCVTADNFRTGTRAAALGGTTCVLDFATQDRDGTLRQALETWHKKAEGSSCNYGFHMAIARWDAETEKEMDYMSDNGVTSYKMYMVYDGLKVDDGQIYAALKTARDHGALIGIHCENWEVLLRRIEELKEQGETKPWGHPVSRPAEVEAEAVARYMRIAQLAGTPAYVVHLSTEEGLIEAQRARARGQEVYLETCPQYLLLTDDRYRDPDGVKFIMSPPLRKDADREALWQGLKEGELDTIGTDHCSFTLAQKDMGREDFTKIPGGLPGVETRGELLYSYGVAKRKISAAQMCRVLSENPARLYGLYPRKGVLRPGSDADIVVYDPGASHVIRAEDCVANVDYNPYEGFVTAGGIRQVWLRGQLSVENGKVLVEVPAGKYMARGKNSL